MLAMRAAVEKQWAETQRAAAWTLGDETLAAEVMEAAIEKAVAYLSDHPPEDHGDVSAILSHFCKEEVRRRRRQLAQLAFVDFSVAPEVPSPDTPFSAAEAAVDAERILGDAPPRVREAMMMRYGCSESWSEVAARTASSPAAIRMSCRRFLERLRRRLGIVSPPQ
jgi:DNA-directed RNA polymerase specialized sigma24 family protein